MPISWTEIQNRAVEFSHEWADAIDENADAKSFWDGLFNVFGVKRRRFANFEYKVTKADGGRGFIDLLWKKVVLVEHKSKGRDLIRAHNQAKDYFPGIKDSDLPRYIVVCDFARFKVFDLDTDTDTEFTLAELPKRIQSLAFIAGYEEKIFHEQDPVNAEAAEKLGALHDELKSIGYEGHELEVFLVRLLFCLFADDTGIFVPRDIFNDYLDERTNEDGSDLGPRLQELFQTLNRPVENRYRGLDASLQEFPYVNGGLFAETLSTAPFTANLRKVLLECFSVDWGEISPAIFGSLFQSIMNGDERRALGAHYTSEKNIMKAIEPLFVEDLRSEFLRVKTQRAKLLAFHEKLRTLRFFDPACGCGNFLVIAYRELRLLELEVIEQLHKRPGMQLTLDAIRDFVKVDVDQFHGIEIEEWPAQIARVAMWLIDHQMNVKVSGTFGIAMARVPLVRTANIVQGDALLLDWNTVLPSAQCTYLLGNPPFRGARLMDAGQKISNGVALTGVRGANQLDLVAGWYAKAARFLSPTAKAVFVSTNSITQGEQVGILWSFLLEQGVKIHFAHRTFKWQNEAGGLAAVHCVIIGFALFEPTIRRLFDYATVVSEPVETKAENINPYLVDAENILLSKRRKPLSVDTANMMFGSMANDEGALLINSQAELDELIARDPAVRKYVRPFYQVEEFLYDAKRWCLWLVDAEPRDIQYIDPIRERLANCRKTRLASTRLATKALAATPGLFGEIRQPTATYLLVPRHTGETRRYIPMAFVDPNIICGDANLLIPNATLFDFGVLTSLMHMAWVASVCGRIKSDFRYSSSIVYNNFPWPTDVPPARIVAIEKGAQKILEVRAHHKGSSLASLYDPLTMPKDLLTAHRALDRAVDAAYSRRVYDTDGQRVAYLFGKYKEKMNSIAAIAAVRRPRTTKPRLSAIATVVAESEDG
ncbi:class I SAM-dependent DNA methyltransferase [Janthinobacterium lividum]|uniref:class I SAM-dependent DNA methyltransferase n=1 Tax=Janthinobacterium lividum TaxID=29581 RepID=UPI0009B8AB62|nr:DNA methyltransferase [Janthinobacterium lividum]